MTESALLTNKKRISEYYHFSQSGSDFTYDMHEKHQPISVAKSVGPLKTEFSATKNLDMGQSPTQHTIKTIKSPINSCYVDIPASEDHPGIKNIKSMQTKPSSVNKELKNPREFEAFVDNLTDRYIPAILIAPNTPCAKIVVFYHANAEDIGQAYSFCKDINDKLEVH